MTLLDRLRTSPPDKHPDPAVRLAHVAAMPLEDQAAIAAIARGDDDARVRQAAVAKLLDPAALGAVAREDAEESVRNRAAAMLRDLALEAFEGVAESDSLDAVDALIDPKAIIHVARQSTTELIALRALGRVNDVHALGSIARHGVLEAVRLGALESLRQRGEHAEIVAVAMNGEHKEAALAAVELVAGDRDAIDLIAARGRNKAAAKRARGLIRGAEERTEGADSDTRTDDHAAVAIEAADQPVDRALAPAEPEPAERAVAEDAPTVSAAVDPEPTADREADREEEEARAARLAAVADAAAAAAATPDLDAARRTLDVVGREWRRLSTPADRDSESGQRFLAAEAAVSGRLAERDEVDTRARREALGRLRHLLGRVDALVEKPDVTLKACERGLRDVRAALASVPPLPPGPESDEVVRRLKTGQTALMLRAREMREAVEWQQWANGGVQEQLCTRMEALAEVNDPAAVATEVRVLRQQWREVADAPRAQAEQLWKRFKTAHDAVWPKCQEFFAAEAEARAANLARKTALCERAEALSDSTSWIQTAEAIKELQAEWKTIGPVSRGREKAVWERFRSACDRFFTRRHADLAERKKTWAENYARKEALVVRAEALAASTEWDAAASEVRRLQAEWKAIGPVKKSRSEAIWKRFRTACDLFFTRYNRRDDSARAERAAAREALCAELESLAAGGEVPPDLPRKVRAIRGRWQHEVASRAIEPARARALDERFTAALTAIPARWPAAFAGTEFDPDASRRRMESLVARIEALAQSLASQDGVAGDERLTPAERLAARLKEALASNTIGGKAADDSRWRAAADEVRQAKAAWARLGPVPDEVRRALGDRFHRACRSITERGLHAAAG